MAIKEELIISARAETSKAEEGLRKIADEAEKLAGAQDDLANSTKGVAGETDKAAAATDAAAKAMAESATKVETMAAEIERLKQQMKDAASETKKQTQATDDAGDKFTEAAGKARKLSDQLREVADEADIAAGNLITKFGGAGAIKSIAMVGSVFAGVKAGVEMFNESAEKMFRGFGEDGQKVWDNVERSLFKIQGAFAETLLGTDDMYQAGAKMKIAYEGVYAIWSALIAPLGWIKDALAAVIPFEELYADEISSATEALKRKTAMEKGGIDPVLQRAEADRKATEALAKLYEVINPYLLTKQQMIEKERSHKIAIIETERAEVAAQLNRAIAAAASVQAAKERAAVTAGVMAELRAEAVEVSKMPGRYAGVEREFDAILRRDEASGEIYRRITDRMIVLNTKVKASINSDWSIAPAMRQALVDADRAIEIAKAKNVSESMGDLMFGDGSEARATTAGTRLGTRLREGVTTAMADGGIDTEGKGNPDTNMISAMLGIAADVEGPISRLFQKIWNEAEEQIALVPRASFMDKLNIPTITETTIDFRVINLEKFVTDGEKAQGIITKVVDSFEDLKKTATDIALSQLSKAPTEIAKAWGAAKGSGEDAASAIGEAATRLIADMASEWGSFFVKQGIAMWFTNPVVGAGLIAAGIGLSALAGYVGAEPAPTSGTDETEAESISSSAVTSQGMGQQSFGYFEGGRSPVTIVTNDAASIRVMQHRLSFVAARGGSGV